MDIVQFIYPLVDRCLDCFQVLAVMRKAPIEICIWCLCECMFLFILGTYFGLIFLLGHMVSICLTLSKYFLRWLYDFVFPQKMYESSSSSTFLSVLGVLIFILFY